MTQEVGEQILVHCPGCGSALSIAATIAVVKRYNTELQFQFHVQSVEHECAQ